MSTMAPRGTTDEVNPLRATIAGSPHGATWSLFCRSEHSAQLKDGLLNPRGPLLSALKG